MTRSWVPVPDGSDFTHANLPYGMFSTAGTDPRPGVAVGESILDLRAVAARGLLSGVVDPDVLAEPTLNAFLDQGRQVWSETRRRVGDLLEAGNIELADDPGDTLVAQADATMYLPVAVGDYVDFYSSIEHATNLGRMFRPDGEPLLPNWRHLPVGYHGRSSTVVVSGTPVHRPCGQRKPPDADAPTFGPSQLLDIELEVGFLTGPGNELGHPIPVDRAREHIFGLVLVNDWSARDIQAWEYQPLGPFLGKSFATSISPWIVPLEALEPFLVEGPAQDPEPLEYLRSSGPWNVDLALEVGLQTEAMAGRGEEPAILARVGFRDMYWNMAQQLAHATVNGTAVRAGDLYASGTVSQEATDARGSLIEMTWRGAEPITLPDGETRTFLADNDTVVLRGHCGEGAERVGFGEVRGTILPPV